MASKRQIFTGLPDELVKQIDEDAKRKHRSRSQQIKHILSEHYEKERVSDGRRN